VRWVAAVLVVAFVAAGCSYTETTVTPTIPANAQSSSIYAADGTLITIGIGAANRDPAQFPEPDRFDVARKPNRHVAFGQGDHVCVGMNVARMEGRIAFARMLQRFTRIEPDGAPERDRRIRFRGFRRLPVRVG
jgi:cytochrome P450